MLLLVYQERGHKQINYKHNNLKELNIMLYP